MRISRVVWLPFMAALASCNADDSGPAQPARPEPHRQVGAGDAGLISTGTECSAAFATPRQGLKVLFRGPVGDRIWIEQRVTGVQGARTQSKTTMLMGPERERGPSHDVIRRDAFVVMASGTSDAPRTNVYGSELTGEAIRALSPGGVLTATVTESSDFAGVGTRDVSGEYRVTFVGCATLDVNGVDEPAKVFDVRSVSRSFNMSAPEGSRDSIRETSNRYWVSERVGWVIKNEDRAGAMVAVNIDEPR